MAWKGDVDLVAKAQKEFAKNSKICAQASLGRSKVHNYIKRASFKVLSSSSINGSVRPSRHFTFVGFYVRG